MGLMIHQIVAFLSVVVLLVGNHAASLPSDEYWNSKLPNTPMPESVKDLLHPTASEYWLDNKDDGTTAGITNGGINADGAGSTQPGGGGDNSVDVGHGGVGVDAGGGRTNVGVGNGGINVGTHTKSGKPIYVGVKPGPDPFQYQYAASETQLHDNPNVALFFLEKDLKNGKKMNLQFPKNTKNPTATFLPRELADSIPFSSEKLPEILDTFSVKPGSYESESIKKTIQECEEKGIKGEEKLCTTSLESMIDFVTTALKLGKNVEAISTTTSAENGRQDSKSKEYKIAKVEKMPSEKPLVVCHRQEYAYAVFYCHKTENTVAYKVDTVAVNDKSMVEAVAVCHRDTAAWNPKHLAFQVLKVKPGTVPICHFLPRDHIVWVSKN